ncbi:MAG: hypothetical protein NTZ35_01350 [Ignavibacteriales bacterium]|nr:hypothetical protein [Ignavibacteriales bacterium]
MRDFKKWNPNTWYKRMKKLEKLGYISMESDNRNTLVTVAKYEEYQNPDGAVTAKEQQENNRVTTGEQQDNTNNNGNNGNKVSKGDKKEVPDFSEMEATASEPEEALVTKTSSYTDEGRSAWCEAYRDITGLDYPDFDKGREAFIINDIRKKVASTFKTDSKEDLLYLMGQLFRMALDEHYRIFPVFKDRTMKSFKSHMPEVFNRFSIEVEKEKRKEDAIAAEYARTAEVMKKATRGRRAYEAFQMVHPEVTIETLGEYPDWKAFDKNYE